MRNVLVTGGSGFLARSLIARLRRQAGLQVQATDLRPGPDVMPCDLCDPRATRRLIARCRPDAIVHLAGSTKRLPWQQLWDVHVATTLNILAALPSTPIRLVVAGSSAEYGAPRALPVKETAATEPVSAYGASKLAQTLAALSANNRGLRVAVARIFNVLGPGMPDNLALGSFARQIAAAEAQGAPAVIRTGNLQSKRDYIDVRDAAEALQGLLLRPGARGIFNVCSGRSFSMRELAQSLAAQARNGSRIETDGTRFRKYDVPDIYGDSRRLRAAIGWRPRIPIEKSLCDTLDWYRRDLESQS